MADSNHQMVNKLTFFPSHALYAYSCGLLDNVFAPTLNSEERYSLINMDPCSVVKVDSSGSSYIKYRFHKEFHMDFIGLLSHDLSSFPQILKVGNGGDVPEYSTTPIVNDCFGQTPTYNGWSMSNINAFSDTVEIDFTSDMTNYYGTFLFGKKWTAPINVDIKQTLNIDYGYKSKKTISGKTISTMNYSKAGRWLMDAWELSDTEYNTRHYGTDGRNGVRTWTVSMTSIQDSNMMSQNNMLNSSNWTTDTNSQYFTDDAGNSSYNTSNSNDFYSAVIKKTMGGHLPCVVRISDSNNSDQWAIVRISDYKITQNNPKLVDIKLILEEQV